MWRGAARQIALEDSYEHSPRAPANLQSHIYTYALSPDFGSSERGCTLFTGCFRIFETENAFWSLAASKAFVVVHTLQLSVA